MENKGEPILVDDQLIARYLSGEANPDEAIAIHLWLETSENRLYFEKLEIAWNASFPSRTPRDPNIDEAWSSIQGKLKSDKQIQIEKSSDFFKSGWAWKIAASVLIASFISSMVFIKTNTSSPLRHLAIANKGQVEEVKFSDSSIVILNKGASISYPDIFDETFRIIEMNQGEGFFKIAANKDRPFIIHTPIADIKVVGTEFNVALSQDELTVSVVQGRVIVLTPKDSSQLDVGHSAKVRSNLQGIEVAEFEEANNWGYATHSFVFKDVPLKEVFKDIEKSYSFFVDVRNRDIENCKLTATFVDVTADKIISLIAETLNLRVTKNDNHFTIEGKGCP